MSRRERIGGLVWVIGLAVFFATMCVLYLGARVPFPGGGEAPLPWTLLAAPLLTSVLTKTARLWTNKLLPTFLPLLAWVLTVVVFAAAPEYIREVFGSNYILIIALLLMGIGGGVWPLLRRIWDNSSAGYRSGA